MELYQVYQKSIVFVEIIYQWKNFDMNFKVCHLGCQFRTHTRKLIATQIYSKIKYLESGLVCVNVVGQQSSKITLDMKCMKGFDKHTKYFTNLFLQICCSYMIKYLPCLIDNFQAAIHKKLLLVRCRAFENVEPTTILLANILNRQQSKKSFKIYLFCT